MVVGFPVRLGLTCETTVAWSSAKKPEPLNSPGRHRSQAESLADIDH
jgi:hypothetical protein